MDEEKRHKKAREEFEREADYNDKAFDEIMKNYMDEKKFKDEMKLREARKEKYKNMTAAEIEKDLIDGVNMNNENEAFIINARFDSAEIGDC